MGVDKSEKIRIDGLAGILLHVEALPGEEGMAYFKTVHSSDLKTQQDRDYMNNASRELNDLGGKIFERNSEMLIRKYNHKQAIIVPASQCGEAQHRIYVLPAMPDHRTTDVLREIRHSCPNAVPFVSFIGKPQDNPYLQYISFG